MQGGSSRDMIEALTARVELVARRPFNVTLDQDMLLRWSTELDLELDLLPGIVEDSRFSKKGSLLRDNFSEGKDNTSQKL